MLELSDVTNTHKHASSVRRSEGLFGVLRYQLGYCKSVSLLDVIQQAQCMILDLQG